MLDELGELITGMRKAKGWARAKTARELKVSAEHLRRIEQGDSRPSVTLMGNILTVLEMPEASARRAWYLFAVSQVDPMLRHLILGGGQEKDLGPGIDAIAEWLDAFYDLELSDSDKQTLKQLMKETLQ